MPQKRFKPPTLEEVKAYLAERQYTSQDINAEVFWTFYGSKGWMVGKTKMKNWHLAVAGWVARRRIERQEVLPICVIDKKAGSKYQTDNKGKKVWLCEECTEAWNATGRGTWSRLSLAELERIVLEGRALLKCK